MKEAGWKLRLVAVSANRRDEFLAFLTNDMRVTKREARAFLDGAPLPASECDDIDRTFLKARIEQQTGASIVWERSRDVEHPREAPGAS